MADPESLRTTDVHVGELYDELRRLAALQLRARAHSLQPTAIVHEAWLRLKAVDGRPRERAHFLSAAALAIRHVLVDHERKRRRQKRGGAARRTTFVDGCAVDLGSDLDLLEIEDAIQALARLDARKAKVVELKLFAGATIEETAAALGVSHMTVSSDWQHARRWLSSRLLG